LSGITRTRNSRTSVSAVFSDSLQQFSRSTLTSPSTTDLEVSDAGPDRYLPIGQTVVWPCGCVQCGEAPTRFEEVGTTSSNKGLLAGGVRESSFKLKGARYCGAHKKKACLNVNRTSLDHLLLGGNADVMSSESEYSGGESQLPMSTFIGYWVHRVRLACWTELRSTSRGRYRPFPNVYAFCRGTARRNLYRIPVP
jgi:hypothetical protein